MSKRAFITGAAALLVTAAFLFGSMMLPGAFAQKSAPRSSPGAQVEQGEGVEQGKDREQGEGVEQGEDREQGEEKGQVEERPSYRGSIQVSQDESGRSDEEEAAALQAKARITAEQARSSALARFDGAIVHEVTLDNEDGSLVYSVVLTDKAGHRQDVKVDAGNAKVLNVEADGPEGDNGKESSAEGDDVD